MCAVPLTWEEIRTRFSSTEKETYILHLGAGYIPHSPLFDFFGRNSVEEDEKMIRREKVLLGLIMPIVLVLMGSRSAQAQCIATGFSLDGINLTAVLINPTTTVTGPVNGAGCNIGVYYSSGKGKIDQAEIYGANYAGVVVNGDNSQVSVNITNSKIHDIGERPLNGTQHGWAIYYRAFSLTGSATGTISDNTISYYQKGGLVANGQGTSVVVTDNDVEGQGPVGYIAQNGIQIGYGADATVTGNTVTGNSYTGTIYASAGILVVGGAFYGICPDGNDCPYTVGTRIMGNVETGNDVGIWLSDAAGDGSAPTTATNIKAVNNTITNDFLTNGSIYQAGVSDEGNNDKIIANRISGNGYNPTVYPGEAFTIDVSTTNRAKVRANK